MKIQGKHKLYIFGYFLTLFALFISGIFVFKTSAMHDGNLNINLVVDKIKVENKCDNIDEFQTYFDNYLNELNQESTDNDFYKASQYADLGDAYKVVVSTRRIDKLKGLGDIRYAKGEHFFKNNNTNQDLITNRYNGLINSRLYRVYEDGSSKTFNFKFTEQINQYKIRMKSHETDQFLSLDNTLNLLGKNDSQVVYFELVDFLLFDEISFEVNGQIKYYSNAFNENDDVVENIKIDGNKVTLSPLSLKAVVDGDMIDANLLIGYFVFHQNPSPVVISLAIVGGIFFATIAYLGIFKGYFKKIFTPEKLKKIWKFKTLYLLLVPAIGLLIFFRYMPMTYLVAGFMEYNPLEGLSSEWIGLKYFQRILYAQNTPEMYRIFRNTIFISLIRIVSNIPFILFLALVINSMKHKRIKTIFQGLSMVPYFLSWVAVGGLFYSMLNSETGLVNRLFDLTTDWYTISDPWWSILSISSLWKGMGWSAIIYIAGMCKIDIEQYEAAKIDGCGPVRQALSVTIPGIMSIIALQMILDVANIMRDNYDQIYAMTNGSVMGPLQETVDVVGRIALTSLRDGNFGSATAIGLIQGVIGFILVLLANHIVRKSDNEGIM